MVSELDVLELHALEEVGESVAVLDLDSGGAAAAGGFLGVAAAAKLSFLHVNVFFFLSFFYDELEVEGKEWRKGK